MFGDTFEHSLVEPLLSWFKLWGAVLSAGVVIKLIDDYLDAEVDKKVGVYSFAARLGPAILPYCVIAIVIGTLLHAKVASVLLLGAYAVGMGHSLKTKLPTGLQSWHESLVATGLAMAGAGIPLAMTGLMAMIFVQCVDDLIDASVDKRKGQLNAVHLFGGVETALLAVSSFVIAVSLNPLLMTTIVASVPLVEWMMKKAVTSRFIAPSSPKDRGGAFC